MSILKKSDADKQMSDQEAEWLEKVSEYITQRIRDSYVPGQRVTVDLSAIKSIASNSGHFLEVVVRACKDAGWTTEVHHSRENGGGYIELR